MSKVRLSKVMSERGMCSRREADQYIEEGVVRVDGELVTELGTKIDPDAKITLDYEKENISIAFYKPLGIVSTQPEKGYETAVDLLEGQLPLEKLSPCGRLDIDSQGLMIFTTDGALAKAIIGENSPIDKEYLIRLDREATDEQIDALRFGIFLDDKPLKKAIVTRNGTCRLKMTLVEGKKRQIRRMCDVVGLHVAGLPRIRIGPVHLGDLKPA
ncbi:MAG: pseudouridine synthase, partial [Simkaniaceae bacterium]|nr:pseudouridine synthase [Simkaniaceae bacterium]